MSIGNNGRELYCDAPGCSVSSPVPVRLRYLSEGRGIREASGWLYVVRDGVQFHYCQACARDHPELSRSRQ